MHKVENPKGASLYLYPNPREGEDRGAYLKGYTILGFN
jgi:hypothetical protein